MSWTKEPKEKVIDGFTVRRLRKGYRCTKDHGSGKKDIFEVWSSIHTDRGWRENDFTPFITQRQADSKLTMKKNSRKHYENMVYKVRKSYKRRTGKDISSYELKKKIKQHSEIEARKLEITTTLEEIKKEKNLEDIYKNAKIYVQEETGRKMCELEGKTLFLDEEMLNADFAMGVIPESLSEPELWELYGDVAEMKTETKEETNAE